jgi:PAS domain S-box-containing protein
MHAALWEAVHAGLVFRQDSAYKFLHDRIQQAAYSLIPDEHRADVHLRIGRALARMTADELAEHLFDVANQFNRGATRVVDRDEKAQVATIDLRGGRKAKASAAFASARAYFAAGMALLDERDWGSQYELMFSLWLERAECELLSGDFNTAEQLIEELLQRCSSKIDKAAAYRLKIDLHAMKSDFPQAVDTALTGLKLFGIDLPAHPTWEQVQAEYETLWRNLDGRPIESLIDLPLMTDPELHAAMLVLSVLFGPAYFTDFHLYCGHLCRMVNISLQHGMSGASAAGYAGFGVCLGGAFHRYREGYRFAKVACDLVEKHGFIAYQAKVYFAMGLVAPWTQPITTAIEFTRAASRTATETGDLAFACYSMSREVASLLLRNDPLDAVWRESERSLDFVQKAKFRDVADMIVSHQRFIATMQGRTTTFSTFSDAQFDEATFEAQLTEDRVPIMICLYWILKLKARFLSGDYAEALASADKANALLWAMVGRSQLLDYFYYTAVTIAALYENGSADEQNSWRKLLAVHRDQLREWTDNNPPTFGGKYALVSAEIGRLEGRDADAMRLYEEAIRSARENGFVQDEGLAHELAARFYAARGAESMAHASLRNARHCYLRWGASGKVRQLEQLHPHLRDAPVPASLTTTIGAPVERLDVGTVLKAAQAVSGEIELSKLIKTLLRIAVEHAGAGRGLLILFQGDEPQIAAEATTDRGQVEVTLRQTAVSPADLPASVLNYLIRTRESVILDDALVKNPFSADEYICQKQARSVLCLPLAKQAKLIGVLYLENNLASHVFTPARISVLELLASQAAISLQNARLYNDLQEREARIRRLVDSNMVGIVFWDVRGRIIDVNQAFLDMVGYTQEDLVSGRLRWTELTPTEWRDADERIIAELKAVQTLQPREKEYFRKDGSRVAVLVARALFEWKPDEGVSFVIDITERKRAELERQRLASLVEQAEDLMAIADLSGGTPIYLNKAGMKMVGFDSWEEAKARRGIHYILPEDRQFVNDVLWPTVLEKGSWSGEMRFRHFKTGEPIPILYSAFRIDDPETGKPVNIGNVCRDITDRKRAEEELRASEKRLLDAQMELARVTRVTTLGELTASIAHEVNQPLAAVVNAAGACRRWLDGDTPNLEEAHRALDWITREGNRASEVIQRVRALAKKTDIEKVPLDVNDVVREVIALVQRQLMSQQVSLHVEFASTLPTVTGDRVQLQQVIINLVMNGTEAMQSVTDRQRELVIRSRQDETEQVLVSVADCGVGISAENAGRLFNAFFTTKSSGMGIGLSICRSIIEAHGGRLWATANIPHGTTFQFTLPANVNTAS